MPALAAVRSLTPNLAPMLTAAAELHIWEADLDQAGEPPAASLPAAERARAGRVQRPLARRRWLAARWALRVVLGCYLDEEPAAIELRLGARGKPMLGAPWAGLRFNLSHSGGLALLVLARGAEVGVDIERISPRRDVLALSKRLLNPAELRSVEEAPPAARSAVFHAAWARREAIAKCSGVGLGAPLPADVVAVSAIDAGPGFAAAVAVAGNEVPLLRRFTPGPLLGQQEFGSAGLLGRGEPAEDVAHERRVGTRSAVQPERRQAVAADRAGAW
jgi:4'-phosphopantetheinyl transferase